VFLKLSFAQEIEEEALILVHDADVELHADENGSDVLPEVDNLSGQPQVVTQVPQQQLPQQPKPQPQQQPQQQHAVALHAVTETKQATLLVVAAVSSSPLEASAAADVTKQPTGKRATPKCRSCSSTSCVGVRGCTRCPVHDPTTCTGRGCMKCARL
jgi:hypothetical protein